MEDRRREDTGDDDDAEAVDRLGLEEVAYIHLPEDVPADDGGEGKDEEADSEEDNARLPKGLLEGTLCDLYRDQPRLSISPRQEDDECRSGADEEVNEDTRHRHEALNGWILDMSQRMGVWGRAHTCFVGEEPAGDPIADGVLHHATRCTASGRLRGEGITKDGLEDGENLVGVHEEDDDRPDDIGQCHKGHHQLGDGRDALLPADDDDSDKHCDEDTADPALHTEGVGQADGDGVRLHHTADEAEGDDDHDGEDDGEHSALQTTTDVVGRSPDDLAVAYLAILLGEDGFREDRAHPKHCGDPHPEDGTRASHSDGGGYASDITRTDLGGDGSGERLEGVRLVTGIFRLLFLLEDRAEAVLHRQAEVPYLGHAEVDGVEDADAEEDVHEEVVP